MAGPLLESKLRVPALRPRLVGRRRLDERLHRVWETTLTVVSAPAGFGKSTLLSQWLAAAGDGRGVAWLSLDPRDDDPVQFWTYVVAALQPAVPGVGTQAAALLQPRSSAEPFLTTLLNELAAAPRDVVLVLDDYHVIGAREVHEGMAFLLEHLPPRVHVVLAGRADPVLPLGRLRARGELVELRAADLRFTPDESSAYLTDAMALDLSPDDVAALEARTEGWIAALQLAALSLRGRDDAAGFIANFAGDDRYVVDLLVEEVLQRQPDDVRDFLLRTSVLGRLTAALCDAVTARPGSAAMLGALERANLFLVPLDGRRRWFRYHHLFADVLRARLRDDHPGLEAGLHRRASAWFAEHDEPADAVEHALAAGDAERAADLVERQIPAMRQGRREATLRRWLEALPDDVVRARPVLSVGYAGTLLVFGELDGVEDRLGDAERRLDAARASGDGGDGGGPAAGSAVADAEALRALPGSIAVYRAAQARALGDTAGTVTHARRALDLVTDGDRLGRGAAAGLLGLAHWTAGDLGAAHRWWSESRAQFEAAEFRADVMGIAIALSDIETAQGRLRDAMRTLRTALDAATGDAGQPPPRGSADMHVGMAEILREQGDLDGAARHLQTALDLGEAAELAQNRYRRRVAAARLRVAEGDLAAAVPLLDDAERVYTGDFFPDVRPVAAVRARVRLLQGEVGEVLGWARERGLAVDDDPDYLREHEHLTLVRALLARHRDDPASGGLDDVEGLLTRLLRAAEDGGRAGGVLEALVLLALVRHARGDVPGASAPLRRALELAEPEGYVRLFADEGAPMAALLRAAAPRGVPGGAPGGYVHRLLTAVAPGGGPGRADPEPVERLSARELEVLRLLASDLDGPEIARRLFVSLNTLRTHTRNVYAKLGVTSRRAAVRRAADLGVLGRDDGR